MKKETNKKIKVFETFAGIGAQHKAITNIGEGFEVVGTSEWDVRSIIAYAQIHNKEKFEKLLKDVSKWSDTKVSNYIKSKTFSLNTKTVGNPNGKNREFKNNLIAANIANNNFPDINKVTGDQINGADLLTYSFPCQGLSIASGGKDKGISEDVESTSNLIWQIRRILLDAKTKNIKLPKYLLMENVKNLLSEKHKPDYERWLDFLESIGYSTNTIVLNGINHKSLQKRERVFAISTLNETKHISDEELQKYFDTKSVKYDDITREKIYKQILNSSTDEEIISAQVNNTPNRVRMIEESVDILERNWRKDKWTFNTLTTKQDRIPNVGMIEVEPRLLQKDKLHKRLITTREGYLITGFTNEDYDKVKIKYNEGIITKDSLYRQAGNSIVVSVLEDIFTYILDKEKENK